MHAKKHNHIVRLTSKRAFEKELKHNDFRVAIFGSARIKKDDKTYKVVYNLAKEIGEKGFDIVTGGGPGLMEAANAGHEDGDEKRKSDSIGLTIQLSWEPRRNIYIELKKHFHRFSSRLDHFMALASAAVITPGGIGTALEFFYTLQLIQVKHINPIPIILLGDMWTKLIEWIKKYPIKKKLANKCDLDNVYIAKNNREAMKIILKTHEIFKKEGKKYGKNIKKYKLD
jgi:hypothetical protein